MGRTVEKTKYNPARYVGSPNIEKIQGQFLAVLKREAQHLLDESHLGKLSEESSKTLNNYLKLIGNLKEPSSPKTPKENGDTSTANEAFDDFSTEDLKKLALKPIKEP